MTKDDIEKIIAIQDEGSMAAAAKKLFMTQPALSKCLRRVEQELGEVLFIRRPSGMVPTYAGECFIRRGHQLLKIYNDMEMEFCELNQMRKGVLRVGSANRVGSLILPELLKQFSARYPNISVDIVEKNSVLLEQDLLDGSLDLAIVCLPIENENLTCQVFYEDPLYVAIPSGSSLNQYAYAVPGEEQKYFDLQKLAGSNFLLTRPFNKTRMAADRVLKQLAGDYNIVMQSKNIDTIIRFVAAGMGVSLVPAIYTKIYGTGETVQYYQIEKKYLAFWQWAVIFNNYESLTRPSKALFDLLKTNGCQFPPYIQ